MFDCQFIYEYTVGEENLTPPFPCSGANHADDDTEIYWLRPKPRSPKYSPSDSDRVNWFSKAKNSSQKLKVTFDEAAGK